jgi:hypothetical protein
MSDLRCSLAAASIISCSVRDLRVALKNWGRVTGVVQMKNTLVTTLSASMLAVAAIVAMPSNAQSQVVVIIGNGAAQPYYQPQYPVPYARPTVVYNGGYYGGYGYRPYGGYYGVGYGYGGCGGCGSYGYPGAYYGGYYGGW